VRWHAAKEGEHGAALACRGFGERERTAPHGVASPRRPCRPCVKLPWCFAQAPVEAGVQKAPSRAAATTAPPPAVTAKAVTVSSRTPTASASASANAGPQFARTTPTQAPLLQTYLDATKASETYVAVSIPSRPLSLLECGTGAYRQTGPKTYEQDPSRCRLVTAHAGTSFRYQILSPARTVVLESDTSKQDGDPTTFAWHCTGALNPGLAGVMADVLAIGTPVSHLPATHPQHKILHRTSLRSGAI
jgi:hypothetical protein